MPVALASPVEEDLDRFAGVVDELVSLDLTGVDREGLVDLLRGVEVQRRRLPVHDHRLIAELDQRGVAGELCARDTKALLRETLRLSPDHAAVVRRAVCTLPAAIEFEHGGEVERGWAVHMSDGIPWWTPPPRIDQEQKPIRNTVHQPREWLR